VSKLKLEQRVQTVLLDPPSMLYVMVDASSVSPSKCGVVSVVGSLGVSVKLTSGAAVSTSASSVKLLASDVWLWLVVESVARTWTYWFSGTSSWLVFQSEAVDALPSLELRNSHWIEVFSFVVCERWKSVSVASPP